MIGHARAHAACGLSHPMTPAEELAAWLLMVVAMMFPAVAHAVRTTAFASLWRRRHRATAGFLIGYLAPWAVAGVAVAVAALRSAPWARAAAAPAAAFLLAALWQVTPVHAAARAACHRRLPLAPDGWRADRDCLRFGHMIGVNCLLRCWPLMLACALAAHGSVAMLGGSALGILERRTFRHPTGRLVGGTLLIAAYYAALAARA
jgi:predicted metal-binding membrane protein